RPPYPWDADDAFCHGDRTIPVPGYGDGDISFPGDGDGDVFYPGDGDGPFTNPLTGCEVDWEDDYGDGQCELSYECDNGYLYTSCWNEYDGRSYCYCDGGNGYAEIQVGDDSTNACRAAAEFCANPSVVSAPVCSTSWEDASQDYCNMEESCTSNGQSSGGVPISVSQWRSTWCEGRAGEWNCECYGAQSNNLQISFTPSANGITACREAR